MRRTPSRAVARSRPLPWLPLMFLLSIGTLILAGCETAEGFGEDLQAAGGALEQEAEEDEL